MHVRQFSGSTAGSAKTHSIFTAPSPIVEVPNRVAIPSHSRNASASSLPLSSPNRSFFTRSPSPRPTVSTTQPRLANIIEPFNHPPSEINPDVKRRPAQEVYGSSSPINQPPQDTTIIAGTSDTQSQRPVRWNPPTYDDAIARDSVAGRYGHHASQGSVESLQSALSNSNSGIRGHRSASSGGHESNNHTAITSNTGRRPRDHKRAPAE